MSDFLPDAFVFDGQGSAATTSSQTTNLALQDAQLPLGSTLLLACHQAFLKEFASLSPADQARSGIDINAFLAPRALIDVPPAFRANAVLANTNLYLIQLLRYLANVDPASFDAPPAADLIGFSTGVFAAVVVATSTSIPQLLVHAIETFRFAFWLGYHAHLYTSAALAELAPTDPAPWSLVLFGATRAEASDAVSKFNAQRKTGPHVYLTAITSDTCVTVSGRPDALAAFTASAVLPSCSSKPAAIHALYHAPALLHTKAAVLASLASRAVRMPAYTDLARPLRSPITGEPVTEDEAGAPTLAEAIVDMTLLHPVNFDTVARALHASASPSRAFRVANIGPGTSLARSLARSLHGLEVSVADWSSTTTSRASAAAFTTSVKAAKFDDARQREPIAVVGMAVNLPGAKDADGLWSLLENGLNTVSEIPQNRFSVAQYNNAGGKRALKTKFGNFMDAPDAFDNAFFRISPREARSMDPQQRVLLQVAHHALESAGYVPNGAPSEDPDTFAAYVGVATNDYVMNLRNDVDVYYSTGTLQAFLSGKLSYAFGFSGPSMVIDTACSSSIIAIYQACRALTDGDCNAAIAGGVNVIGSPDMYIGLDRAHFLSPTGQCKPWDASADGYCRSEGCGLFVLKRLSDALAENDNILGVIRGIEVNQSAHAESITHPHVPTQVQLFHKLLAASGVPAQRVSVIEAHGTGTQAGDPTELESIRAVFSVGRSTANPLHVTSVKANIGHAEAASGAAGLAKLLLMLRRRALPPVISLKTLNPRIPDLALDHTVIDTQMTEWRNEKEGEPLMGLLNNFGAAGSNGALIVEEPPKPRAADPADAPPAVILGFSADSEVAAGQLRAALIAQLEGAPHDALALADVAYSSTARRKLFRHRVAVTGRSAAELLANLRDAQIAEVVPQKGGERAKVLFAFSGQGGQYVGMGAELYERVPFVRKIVDRCHAKLVEWGLPGVVDVIKKGGEVDVESAEAFQAFQSAVFVLEHALASLWIEWGVKPDAVAGHSLGEYAALVTAGVLKLDDALRLVAVRARLMTEKCERGTTGMLALRASAVQMAETLEGNEKYSGLSIACYNSDADCVVGGPVDQLDLLQKQYKESGHKCLRLNVQCAYHTRAMGPILDDLRALGAQAHLAAPTLPVLANVHGVLVQPGDASVFTSEYFARHCGESVRFEQGIQDLIGSPEFATVAACIEIGPHPTTLPMLRCLQGRAGTPLLLPSLRKDASDFAVLCAALAGLYALPVATDIAWRKVFNALAPTAHLVDLPLYPFADTRYWVTFEENAPQAAAGLAPILPKPRFSLLDSCVGMPSAEGVDGVFETPFSQLADLVEGHKVSGFALCPASVYHELAAAGAQLVLEQLARMPADAVLDLAGITYSNPLVYSPDVARTVRTDITLNAPGEKYVGAFSISSYTTGGERQPHCTGFFNVRGSSERASKLALASTMVERRRQAVLDSRGAETFYTRTAYDLVFSRIVAYSPIFHSMKSITIQANGIDAYAVVQLPAAAPKGAYVIHPIFMDTLLHVAGFVINCNAGANEAFICSQVDKVIAVPELADMSATYGVYTTIGFMSDTLAVADAYAVRMDGAQGTVVAHMKRMRFRKLRLNGFKSLLSMAAGGAAHHTPAHSVPQRKHGAPTAAQLSSPTKARDLTADIIRLISDTCGVPVADVKLQARLSDLGIDSLMSIELAGRLQTILPSVHVDSDALAEFHTVGDMVDDLKGKAGAATPHSDSSDTALESDEESTDVPPEQDGAVSLDKIKEIISTILDVPVKSIADDEDLERLGLDSLTAIEARHILQTSLNVDISEDAFASCKSVRELGNAISPPPTLKKPQAGAKVEKVQAVKPSAFGMDVNPARFQESSTDAPPLFLIHDGSGIAHCYGKLSPVGRTLWGIHNPKLPTGEKWEGGVVEMGTYYAGLIKKVVGNKGCIVGGWSFGGVIAYEAARQLIAAGVPVKGLVLIDSPHPLTSSALPDSLIDAVIGGVSANNKLTPLIVTQMKNATRALVTYDPSSSPASKVAAPRAVMLRSREGFPVPKQSEKIQSLEFLGDRANPTQAVAEWESVLGSKVPVLDIPGNHFEVFERANVGAVSERLKEALALFQ
uniref:Polyketide synthase 1 n=1 Tax=Grifola frondosa TaxID=5627 RepID=V5YSL8_GRIFR|nr:polyketide synthase 1 [Grifola frondosa]